MGLSRIWGMALLALVVVLATGQRVQAQNVVLVSKLGGKCLNAEGGTRKGARLIGYNCSGSSNELFSFKDGTIRQGNFCLDASGGAGRDGDQIVLWDCNGGPNQQWRLDGSRLIGINNKCIDLKDAGNPVYWVMNQPAILYRCNGGDNQTWFKGLVVPQNKISNGTLVSPGQMSSLRAGSMTVQQAANVIAMGGGNVIAMGGGNVIAMGGGNAIALVK